jgi:branched-subunit amino acid transport protein
MRWHIIRVLVHKEILRQAANRGGIALAALLVVAALLLTFFSKHDGQPGVLYGGVETCFVDYWEEDGWVRHLRGTVPSEFVGRIQFRHVSEARKSGGLLVYAPLTGAIQIRNEARTDGKAKKIWIWYPDSDGAALAPYELWFWRESALYFQNQARTKNHPESPLTLLFPLWGGEGRVRGPDHAPDSPQGEPDRSADMPAFETDRMHLKGAFDLSTSVAASLVLFALFFSCVYLLPSLMCEERERGVLLAQALSPASSVEILAAKFLFYPAVGIALAGLLAGICKPGVLIQPFFWLALVVTSIGSLGIGLTIACLARTQRTASMGALCYMLVVALFLFVCQQTEIPQLSNIALEFHAPRMLHAALADAVLLQHWVHLAASVLLAAGWCTLAMVLFRRRGWQ